MVTLLLLFVASTLTLRAGPHFTVSVEVVGAATNEISAALSRELGALKDVTVADRTNANYRLNITCISPAISGQPAGYALSILVSRPLDTQLWPQLMATNEVSLLQRLTADCVILELQGVKVIPLTGLPTACREIIHDLDTGVLAQQRQRYSQLQSTLTK